MTNLYRLLTLLLLILIVTPTIAQDTAYRPSVRKAVYFDISPPLREIQTILPAKGGTILRETDNKISKKNFPHFATKPFNFSEDPVWQKNDGTNPSMHAAPIQNFEGIGNLSSVYPPDTQGDISSDKYVQVVNSNFAVYSKTGSTLFGPAALSTIWAGIPAPWNGTNNGDPVVLYDQAANRWLISQFSLPYGNYAELVAISQTADPTGAWYRYVFQFGTLMPDYPKIGVWPDAYYMAINQFSYGSTWAGVGACALERSKMLTGDPTARIVYFNLTSGSDPESMLPSDWDGATSPQNNEPNYFTYYNSWSSLSQQYLKIWQFHVDWSTPSNSTFSLASTLVTAAFNPTICSDPTGLGKCINQPGTAIKLQTLFDRLMFRLQYRNFGEYQTMVTNHTVNADNNGHAGIRWYELRKSGSGWAIYQQGTYAPDATHRWMGSVSMNAVGDIALGYSVSNSTTINPGIRYTGRKASDPAGMMTIPEQTIINGSGSQTGSAARWGDYSGMSVDPSDDNSFWFTTEYIKNTGTANWQTRIASFRFLSATITATPSTICAGQSSQLGTTVTGGTTPYSYSWTSVPAGFTSNLPNPIVQPAQTTLYSVQVSDGTTTVTSNVTVVVTPLPLPTITGQTDLCAGSTGILYNTEAGKSGYTWNISSGGTINSGSGTNQVTVNWSAPGNQTISINYTSAGCAALSPVTLNVLVHPVTATWTGTTSNNWNIGSNWDGGVVPGSCSDVHIPFVIGNNITISSPVSCNTLEMESGASLLGNNFLTVNGTTTVKRNLTGNGINPATAIWHYVSTPLSASTSASFTGGLLNWYDEPDRNWVSIIPTSTTLNISQGYSVAMPVNGDVSFTGGQLNTGDKELSGLTFTGSTTNYSGWHLIGNPFPSALDWTVGNWKRVNIDATVYLYNGTQYKYYTYPASGAPYGNMPNGIIPAEQGFMVKVSSPGTGSLTLPEPARVHHSQAFYKSTVPDLLQLEITGNGYSDQMIVHFDKNATAGFDPEYDAFQLEGIAESPQLYSIVSGYKLAGNVLQSVENSPVIAIGVSVGSARTYSVTPSNLESFSSGITVYLEDLKENRTMKLSNLASYNFIASPGDEKHRFNLHFSLVGIPGQENQNPNVKIYTFEKNLFVNFSYAEDGILEIYDMIGCLKRSVTVNGNVLNNVDLREFPTGFYLIKIKTTNFIISRKIFLD